MLRRSLLVAGTSPLKKFLKFYHNSPQEKQILQLLSDQTTISTAFEHLQKLNRTQQKQILLTQALKAEANKSNFALAENIFEKIPQGLHDQFIYSTMLHVYAKQGNLKKMMSFFSSIPANQRNEALYTTLVNSHVQQGLLDEAERILYSAPAAFRTLTIYNILITGWTKTDMNRAELLFNKIPTELLKQQANTKNGEGRGTKAADQSDRVKSLYQSMFHGYLRSNFLDKATSFLVGMPQVFQYAALYTFLAAALFKQGQVSQAEQLYKKTPPPFLNKMLYTTYLDGYAKSGMMEQAERVFQEMPSDVKNNQFALTSLISGYMKQGLVAKAEQLFYKIAESDRDSVTYLTMLNGYVTQRDDSDLMMKKAALLFQSIPVNRMTAALYATLIDGYLKHGHIKKAEEIYEHMPVKLRSVEVYTVMINGYMKSNQVAKAEVVFSSVSDRNSVTYLAMLNGYVKNEQLDKAAQLFQRIPGARLTASLYTTMLDGYLKRSLIKKAEAFFQTIPVKVRNVEVYTAMIDGYMKQGLIASAEAVFYKQLPSELQKRLGTCNAMVNGYAIHGHMEQAFRVFGGMEQVDEVTFLALLQACSHQGMIDKAEEILYVQMPQRGIPPTIAHWSCLLDCYSRKGLFDKAEALLNSTQHIDSVCLNTVLGACRNYLNVELAEKIFAQIRERYPLNTSSYILMANIYMAVGRTEDADKIREMMNELNLKKIPGITTIVLSSDHSQRFGKHAAAASTSAVNDNEETPVIDIVASDARFTADPVVMAELNRQAQAYVTAGNVEDTSVATKRFESEEELQTNVCLHSERIAIAVLSLNTPPGSTMYMTKNLRVCKNCHNFSKFISKHLNRQLIVRDANRYHHFENGKCSCGDYW